MEGSALSSWSPVPTAPHLGCSKGPSWGWGKGAREQPLWAGTGPTRGKLPWDGTVGTGASRQSPALPAAAGTRLLSSVISAWGFVRIGNLTCSTWIKD